jgi:hypothetical protein
LNVAVWGRRLTAHRAQPYVSECRKVPAFPDRWHGHAGPRSANRDRPELSEEKPREIFGRAAF